MLTVLECTIQQGDSLSDAVQVTGGKIVRIHAPDDWSPAALLSFQISETGNDDYRDVMQFERTELALNCVPGSLIGLRGSVDFARECFLRLRSGVSTNPVAQAADRTFQIVVLPDTAGSGGEDGTLPDTGYLGTGLTWSDGAGVVALPDWLPAPFSAVNGPHGVLEDGGFRCLIGGQVALAIHGYVLHSWDRWIIFGRRWNGGPIIEFGRVQIKSNVPVLIYYEQITELIKDGLLETFISSDFEWTQFAWQQAAMMFLVESSQFGAIVGR